MQSYGSALPGTGFRCNRDTRYAPQKEVIKKKKGIRAVADTFLPSCNTCRFKPDEKRLKTGMDFPEYYS